MRQDRHSFGWEHYDHVAEEPWLEEIADRGPFRFDPTEYERVLREMNTIGVKP